MAGFYKTLGSLVLLTGVVLFAVLYLEDYKYSAFQITTVEEVLVRESTIRDKTVQVVGRAHDDPILIQFINDSILHPAGFPYKLTHPERTDFSEGQTNCVKQILKEKKDGFFVEVGAYDGEAASNSLYWEREKGWTGLLIEANPDVFSALLATKQRRCMRLQAALCFTNTANTTRLDYPQFVKDGLKHLHPPGFSFPTFVDVPCFPLSSILSAIGNPTVDYFAMDIDGGEMDVLRSLDLKSVDIHVFQIEYVKMKGGFGPLQKYMEDSGYAYHSKCVVDGFFVKKGVKL